MLARSIVAAAAVGAMMTFGASPAAAATGTPTPTSSPIIALSTLRFDKAHVDARTAVTDTLTWTVTDSDKTATSLGGDLFVHLEGPNGTYLGTPIDIFFSYGNELYQGGQWVSGTPQKSTYTIDFPVPAWAASSTGIWVVTEFSATDGTHSVDKPVSSFSTKFKDTVTAKEQVDSTKPSYDSLGFAANVRQYHPYVYVSASGGSAEYTMETQDSQSGIWKGSLQLTGPSGQHVQAPFVVQGPNASTTGYECGNSGGDLGQESCGLLVQFPTGSAPGVWNVTKVSVTDNVGNTLVDSVPQTGPVTLTTDSTLKASNFSLTPNPLNDWSGGTTATLTMSVTGASGGVSAVYVDQTAESGCLGLNPTPTVNADGTISVSMNVFQGAQQCGVWGIAIVDGAGNVALYGAEYGAPDPGLVTKQVPDTGPVVSGASLSQTTISQANLGTTPVTITVNFTAPTAPITGVSGYVNDANGIQVSSGSSPYLNNVRNGPETVDLQLPTDLPAGTYTVTFLFQDAGYKNWQFGGVYGQTFPGAPLTLTVTS
jgi:hypothetical protein